VALGLSLGLATACRTPPADHQPPINLATLFGGGSRRILDARYEDVATAARERFVRIYPGGYFALRADLVEDPEKPRLDIVFHEFVDYGHVFETEIHIVGLDDGRTRIEAKVNRFHRTWHFRRRREDLETAFLKVFDDRLRTGNWPPMPWMTAKEAPESTPNRAHATAPPEGTPAD
jgi:hypothetical protein